MPIVLLASAGGSPGVTTCSLALAHYAGALVVDADPHASQHLWSGYFGAQVAPTGGLTHVAEAQRRRLPFTLEEIAVSVGAGWYVPGWQAPASARLSSTLWRDVGPQLRAWSSASLTVIDVGRVGPQGVPDDVAAHADGVVWVTASSLRSVARDRLYLPLVSEQVASVELLVVGPGRPYGADEVAEALGYPLAGTVPWVPDQAAVLSDGAPAPRRRSLAAAIVDLAASLHRTEVAA